MLLNLLGCGTDIVVLPHRGIMVKDGQNDFVESVFGLDLDFRTEEFKFKRI